MADAREEALVLMGSLSLPVPMTGRSFGRVSCVSAFRWDGIAPKYLLPKMQQGATKEEILPPALPSAPARYVSDGSQGQTEAHGEPRAPVCKKATWLPRWNDCKPAKWLPRGRGGKHDTCAPRGTARKPAV